MTESLTPLIECECVIDLFDWVWVCHWHHWLNVNVSLTPLIECECVIDIIDWMWMCHWHHWLNVSVSLTPLIECECVIDIIDWMWVYHWHMNWVWVCHWLDIICLVAVYFFQENYFFFDRCVRDQRTVRSTGKIKTDTLSILSRILNQKEFRHVKINTLSFKHWMTDRRHDNVSPRYRVTWWVRGLGVRVLSW